MKYLYATVVSLGVVLTGCDKEEPKKSTAVNATFTEAVAVSENGAPPYTLLEAQVGQATYQGPTASLVVSGKLQSGAQVRITFSQSSPTAAGANVTNVVEVFSDKAGEATSASGRTTRDATRNQVNGNFTSRFANGTTLDGTVKDLQLL